MANYTEDQLRKLLTSRPGPARQSAFNTGALTELRTVATDDEIEAVRRVVNEVQQTPTPDESYKLSLLARVIERAKAIRLGGHASTKPQSRNRNGAEAG